MIDLGHWVLACDTIENPYGFIYRITNTVNGKMYIGKKQMQTVYKRKPLKGKKNKRCEVKETDWRVYTGSSKELNADIERLGKQQFKFEIIELCTCKWAMSYFEAVYQIRENVLLSEQYYNGIVNLRVGKVPAALKNNLKKFEFTT